MDKKGFVYLVGAGPGDEKLITVKGLEALRKADVVLYDRLVNPLLLQEVNADTELIYCGKLPDRHIVRQEAINELLVAKAKEGKIVVRLKGGDPGVFGRVGEEAEALKFAEICYEIVPGITSGIAAASYAGIPVTHREYGTSFTVVTGHDKSQEGKPVIHWQGLAQGIDTIAFYMGVKNLPFICESLIVNGKRKETKVAVIQWGTTGRQRVVEGTLETIVAQVERHQISNPAITLVGDIVALRSKLQWFEEKRLLGQKVIFPNGELKNINALKDEGAEVLVYPNVTSKPLSMEKERLVSLLDEQDILFLDKDAVGLFLKSLTDNQIDVRSVKAQFYYRDEETSDALAKRGFVANRSTLYIHSVTVGPKHLENRYPNFFSTHFLEHNNGATVAFQRIMEEEGFTTIVFSNGEAVDLFVEQCKKDGLLLSEILQKCQIICLSETANLAVQNYGYAVDVFEKNVENLPNLLFKKIENVSL